MQCEVYKWMLYSGYERAAVQITSFQLHVAKLLWKRSAPSLFEYSRDGICLPFLRIQARKFQKENKGDCNWTMWNTAGVRNEQLHILLDDLTRYMYTYSLNHICKKGVKDLNRRKLTHKTTPLSMMKDYREDKTDL